MRQILVTNSGERFQMGRLLAREDLDLLVVTERPFVADYPTGTPIVVVDSLNDPVATAEAVVRHGAGDRSAVVSLTERSAPAAGYLRGYLGLPGPSNDAVLNCTNKYAMNRRFRQAGLPVADFRLAGSPGQVRTAVAELGLPVLVKPVCGAGADAVVVVRTPKELDSPAMADYYAALAAPEDPSRKAFPVLVEQYLDVVEEYHCDGLVVDHQVRHARTSRYLRPVLDHRSGLFGSMTLPATDALAGEVRALHDAAVRAVGLGTGVTHFEALRTSDGLFAGELAARPGGGGIRRMLELRDGFDSMAAHLDVCLGREHSWAPADAAGEVLQVMLPAARGTVRSISTAEELLKVPGVVEADMRLSPGDVVGGLMDSATVSGIVHARVAGERDAEAVLSALRTAFRLTVDQED
ncbi:hypothetical protein AB0C96_04400 [Streptomyces sp. NPDC048506]|uniref:ATP-grasp domain-containing protein n=1 Tax=Streptomyces sp. NPDC048506 TaxID=3155028 RepID=UPI003420B5EE